MKKRIFIIVALFSLSLVFALPALAADLELVTDIAEILTAQQVDELTERAEEISRQYQFEAAVITLDDISGSDAYDYAKYLYSEYDYGYGADKSGLLLLLSMAERDYALIAYGYGNTAFTDHGKDIMLDKHVLPLLAEDKYYEAFSSYFDVAEEYLSIAATGAPFDVDTDQEYMEAKSKEEFWIKLGITIFVPLVIAGLICWFWAAQMKTAAVALRADNYIPEDSFNLTRSDDRFLYRTTVRRKIEKQSSSGGTKTDSSGFSGRSGKF